MNRAEALTRLETHPTGYLASADNTGVPHVVVVTYAVVTDNVVTAIDHKPKTTRSLKRLRNISENENVSFLVDHYEDDWDRLWWVRVDGPASIIKRGELFDISVDALVDKYPQYKDHRPKGPVIAIETADVSWWSARP